MGAVRWLGLLVLAVLAGQATATLLGWPIPDLPDANLTVLDAKLKDIVNSIFDEHKEKVQYCLGGSLPDVLELLRVSFPTPLPTGPEDDAICSNATSIESSICTPDEIQLYYKYMLVTDNVEKVPSNERCRVGREDPSCAPGFFAARLPLPPDAAGGGDGGGGGGGGPHACCPGYFCPLMLSCMLPCPLGAYCPRAVPADPPPSYMNLGTGQSPLADNYSDKWCAPYGYKQREQGCGGADKWSVFPTEAFPGVGWSAGSGNIFCSGGWYCPDTRTMHRCEAGQFCKTGSSEMAGCPLLGHCAEGTTTSDDNYAGVMLDACLFAALGLLWKISTAYNAMMRKLSGKERLRVMWDHVGPKLTIVKVAEPQATAPSMWSGAAGTAGGTATPEPSVAASEVPEPSPRGSRRGLTSPLVQRVMFWRGAASPPPGMAHATGPVWAQFEAPLLGSDYDADQMSNVGAAAGGWEMDDFAACGQPGTPGSGFAPAQQPLDEGAQQHKQQLLQQQEQLMLDGHYEQLMAANQELMLEPLGRWTRSSLGQLAGGPPEGATRLRLDVRFYGLSLKLRSCGKVVLSNVSAGLRPGRMTAIMGPSGAGKTTLMTTLAGKASYGTRSGTITINGRPDRLERYKRVTGFVPQDDVMHRALSVEENLRFSASMRLPASSDATQRLQAVEHAISVLGLEDVRHALIGDEESRGISGGQRKRVNVGLELVAQPSLLFLDEPTSGLDSSASRLVVQGVQRVARSGMTVAAVIHQPSYETFCMFDDVILLAKGGKTAYYGPVAEVKGYFEGLGFSVPAHMNPPDYYMDIVSGLVSLPSGRQVDAAAEWAVRMPGGGRQQAETEGQVLEEEEEEEEERRGLAGGMGSRILLRTMSDASGGGVVRNGPGRLAASWRGVCRRAAQLRKTLGIMLLVVAQQTRDAATWLAASGVSLGQQLLEASGLRAPRAGSSASKRPLPGFWRQYYLCLCRAVLIRTREPMVVFTEYSVFGLMAAFLGLMGDRGRGTIWSYSQDIVYTMIALAMMSSVAGIRTFGAGRVVFFREAARGLNKAAYFWALDTWDLAGTLLRSACFLTMYYSFAQPRAVVWQMYVVTAAISYCCTGNAYMLSQLMEPNAAQLTAAVMALINALIAQQKGSRGLVYIGYQLSYAHWGLEGYTIAEANRLTGVWLLGRCADLQMMGFDVTQFWHCIRVLLGIGLGFRLVALLSLYLVNRDKCQ